MKRLIIKLHSILNFIKGFQAGYSSKAENQMMIDYDGIRYMVTFEELCNSEDEDMLTSMKKYWR